MTNDPDREPGAGRAAAGSRRSDTSALVRSVLDGALAGDRVQTGFPGLDTLLGGGIRRGDVVVLGGDVGVGKSALALAIARRAATLGHSVGFLSGEMSPERAAERLLALEGRVRVDDLRRSPLDDATHSAVAAAALPLRERAPVVAQLSDAGVAGVSDFLVDYLGMELVVVDPLQYLAIGPSSLDDQLAGIARALKELALRRAVAVLAVTHLGRGVRERSDPRPVLEDLGGHGGIRQQADVVLGLFREELYLPSPHVEGATELHVLKNRNGPRGFVDLYFYKQWLRFEDVMEE